MTINVWDYLQEYEDEKEEILQSIRKVLESGTLILGDSVRNFEEKFSTYCDVKYGVGVDNGTNAIFLALKALNLPPGSEIITVSNTAVPTISAIVSAGHVPKFIDINPRTYLMDVNKIEEAITKLTKCIIPVHLYGQCVDMDVLLSIAEKYQLKVIEDCAQSHGALYKNRKAGSMGDLSTFSFYPTKPLGGYGDGGMVLTNNSEYDKKLRRLRFYGMDKTYYAEEHGYNSRLDEIHAEILLRKMDKLETYIKDRYLLSKRYNSLLSAVRIQLPYVSDYNKHVFYVYVARVKGRDGIIEKLKEKDIHLNISYPWPIHTMKGYSFLGYSKGDLPVTEKAAREIFSLPMYPKLGHSDQEYVCDELCNLLKQN